MRIAADIVGPKFEYIRVSRRFLHLHSGYEYWDGRTPSFQGIIPGGQSFVIPQGTVRSLGAQDGEVAFNWTVALSPAISLILVGSDGHGLGTGGSVPYIIGQGSTSCLNGSSPSSTPGPAAGGIAPTSTGTKTGTGYVVTAPPYFHCNTDALLDPPGRL